MNNDTSVQFDLFISYVETDRPWVEGYLIDALKHAGIHYHTQADFGLGVPFLVEFERAIKQSRHTLLILSPAYLADGFAQFSDLLAQTYGLETATWPVIPLLLHPVLSPSRLSMLTKIDATSPENWSSGVERLCAELHCQVPSPNPKPPCPYPGMIPFTQADAEKFFGRDREWNELCRHLRHQNYIFIIGSSGSGKSSLVSAGLVPQLNRQEPGRWLVKVMHPGSTPLATLAQIIGGLPHSNATYGEHVTATLAQIPGTQQLLIIIDQFEELFTQSPNTDQVTFIAAIKSLRQVPNCSLIVTMRADFYADLMTSELWPVDSRQRMEIVPLRGIALRDAITKPVEALGVYLEVELLERLLADAAEEPGVMPLIQETMHLLWDKMVRRLIPLSAYKQLGTDGRNGLAVAIATKADATLVALPSIQQRIARRIFLRLIQFGEGRSDTRRQQPLAMLWAHGDDRQMFEKVLQYLTENRLLTLSGGEHQGDPKVDIAHEVLITGWPTLQQWLNEWREAEQTRRQLEVKAEEWIRLGQGTGGLLDKMELPEAERWLASSAADDMGLSEALRDLVQISRKVIDDVERSTEEAQQAALEQALEMAKIRGQAVQRLRALVALLTVLCLVSGWLLARPWLLRQRAIALSPVTPIEGGGAGVGTDDVDVDEGSRPRLNIRNLPPFTIGIHEVTNQQYCLCVEAGVCGNRPIYPAGRDVCDSTLARYPVTNTSLVQASTFCTWIGQRLPTEIEWEWAARGGPHQYRFPTGDVPFEPGQINVNAADYTYPDHEIGPWPVGSAPGDRSVDNVQDMAGNVMEWTISLWLPYSDPRYRTLFWPNITDDVAEGYLPGFVVRRGGSWYNSSDSADATGRYEGEPTLIESDLGFRCLSGLPLEEFAKEVIK